MHNLLPFLSYVFVTTFTPGPNNIMSMSNANQYGFKKTQKFIFGVSAGFAIIMFLCSYLNLFLYDIVPKIKTIMDIVGGLYMGYLAVKIMLSKPHTDKSNNEKLNSFIGGLTLQFINPKVILYGITVIGNFITPYYKSNVSLILFSLLLAFVGYVATTCWGIFGALFQRFLSKYQKPFNIFMSILLVYCAISIFIK